MNIQCREKRCPTPMPFPEQTLTSGQSSLYHPLNSDSTIQITVAPVVCKEYATQSSIEKSTACRVNAMLNFTRKIDIARIAKRLRRYRWYRWYRRYRDIGFLSLTCAIHSSGSEFFFNRIAKVRTWATLRPGSNVELYMCRTKRNFLLAEPNTYLGRPE